MLSDFNIFPYPIKDNTYDVIFTSSVLEHLMDVSKVLKELWRIASDKAVIHIILPYYTNYTAYSNIEHIHYFNDRAFKELSIDGLKVEKVKLVPSKAGWFIPLGFLRKFISRYIGGLYCEIKIELSVEK